MNKRITEAFAKGKAFIPFVTCGDPSLDVTEKIVYAMEENGVLTGYDYLPEEPYTISVTLKDLQEKISLLGTDAHYFSTFDEIEDFLLENCVPQDLLITMGAGDVYKIGEHLLGL